MVVAKIYFKTFENETWPQAAGARKTTAIGENTPLTQKIWTDMCHATSKLININQ